MAKPENVQIHRPDGTVLNCELAHEGVDDEGMDHWVIANAVFHPADHVTIGVLPPKTSLGFAGDPDDYT